MPKKPQPKTRDINSVRLRTTNLKTPVWKGPKVDGVTQSMLCDYMVCKERFRVSVIEGISTTDRFNVSIEFGHMWHLCEEKFSAGENWEQPLTNYAAELSVKYRMEQREILKWYNVVKLLFPIYLGYWAQHKDQETRVPLLQEYQFSMPVSLGSGRVIKLRGKMDGVDLIPGKGIFLQENKTKSKIDFASIERQLLNDMQVMTYLTVLYMVAAEKGEDDMTWREPIKGVRYNVIRRPLSGGKGSIRPHQARGSKPGESMEEFYERLTGVIIDDVDYYFERWTCEISEEDLDRFWVQTLEPVLENITDDYEWWEYCFSEEISQYDYRKRMEKFPHHLSRHYRLPYGTYNVVQQGGFSDIDDYLNTGSKVGLQVRSNIFPELDNANDNKTVA